MKKRLWNKRPLALKLTLAVTTIIVLVVFFLTAITINRERGTFQAELKLQALLLAQMIAASSTDSLYFLDGDYLSDLMRDLGRADVVSFGRIYDSDGRIVADAVDPDTRFNINPDSFGQQIIQSSEPLILWRTNQLIVGYPVRVGSQIIGGVSIGLPTAPLTEKITAVRNQGIIIAGLSVLVGLVLALALSRSITTPLKKMIDATVQVKEGDLSYRVHIQTDDELALLGEHFNAMASRLDQTLQQMEAEIEERRRTERELQAAKEAAESANRAKSAFLANMSHELRTPLNAILGFSRLTAHKYPTSSAAQKYLETIYRSGEHLLALINDILEMSKIEAGHMQLNEKTFSLTTMIEEIESMFRFKAEEKGLEFLVKRDTSLPEYIRTDELKLRQILINLLGNAFKFTNEGHIFWQVSAHAPADDNTNQRILTFVVQDTGPGIQLDEIDSMFETFTRAAAGRKSGEGSGLGLALSRQLAHLMGGQITAKNVAAQPGHGAIFTVTLPVTLVEQAGLAASQPKFYELEFQQYHQEILELPLELRRELETAVTRADMVMIDQAIHNIQGNSPKLADFLQRLADNFEYDTILITVQTTGPKHDTRSQQIPS